MFINEYGNRNDPTIILLAPMMISGSDLYGQLSPFFHGSYHIISPDQGGHGKLHLDFGEKDFDLRYSRKTIPVYMPGAELVIRSGYKHCGYMAAHTKEYAEEIERFIGGTV